MAHLKLAFAVAVTLAAITVGLTPRRVALREMLWWAGAVGLAGGALVAAAAALWGPGGTIRVAFRWRRRDD